MLHTKGNSMEWVHRLKAVCSEEEWCAFRDQVLSTFACWGVHRPLLAEEEMWEPLLESVLSKGRVRDVDRYESVLKPHCPDRLRKFYEDYVWETVHQKTNRAGYANLMSYLKKITTYPGGEEAAREITQAWRRDYHDRTTMMDELQKAGF